MQHICMYICVWVYIYIKHRRNITIKHRGNITIFPLWTDWGFYPFLDFFKDLAILLTFRRSLHFTVLSPTACIRQVYFLDYYLPFSFSAFKSMNVFLCGLILEPVKRHSFQDQVTSPLLKNIVNSFIFWNLFKEFNSSPKWVLAFLKQFPWVTQYFPDDLTCHLNPKSPLMAKLQKLTKP